MKTLAAIATATLIALSAATAASAGTYGKASLHTSDNAPTFAVRAFNSPS
ncbi:MAG: hypothetical protein KDJ36_06370 [Hyphomicrobiaceae bacterium]|nr:hypothetical protein [Hyphomicrobiaceae bacterium]